MQKPYVGENGRGSLGIVFLATIFGLTCFFRAEAQAASPTFDLFVPIIPESTGQQVIKQFYGSQPAAQGQAPQLTIALNSLLQNMSQQLTTQVNQKISKYNFTGFLNSMAGASASAAKTLPYDYASDASIFSLSLGVGAAAHNLDLSALNSNTASSVTSGLSNGTVPAMGGAPTVSALLGINLKPFKIPKLGPIDFSRLVLYANFATFTHEFTDISFSFTTFGFHGQYHLVESVPVLPAGLLRWGGLSVGTGFDYSDYTAGFSETIPTGVVQQNFSFANQNLTAQIGTGNAQLSARISTGSIPFEAMTSLQLLYLFTLYTGAGIDLNFGSASLNATSTEPLTLSDPNNPSNSLTVVRPSASLIIPSGAPSLGDLRGFVGLQLNLFVLAAFVQANADTANNLAVNLGARIFW